MINVPIWPKVKLTYVGNRVYASTSFKDEVFTTSSDGPEARTNALIYLEAEVRRYKRSEVFDIRDEFPKKTPYDEANYE